MGLLLATYISKAMMKKLYSGDTMFIWSKEILQARELYGECKKGKSSKASNKKFTDGIISDLAKQFHEQFGDNKDEEQLQMFILKVLGLGFATVDDDYRKDLGIRLKNEKREAGNNMDEKIETVEKIDNKTYGATSITLLFSDSCHREAFLKMNGFLDNDGQLLDYERRKSNTDLKYLAPGIDDSEKYISLRNLKTKPKRVTTPVNKKEHNKISKSWLKNISKNRHKIPVNIWDDYFDDPLIPIEGEQKTYAYIEDGGYFPTYPSEFKIKALNYLCEHLKSLDEFNKTDFSIGDLKINIVNLTHKDREKLVKTLKKSKLSYEEGMFDIYSES